MWAEIMHRINNERAVAEREIENSDSFEHGRAVGKRAMLKMLAGFPEQFIKELKADVR